MSSVKVLSHRLFHLIMKDSTYKEYYDSKGIYRVLASIKLEKQLDVIEFKHYVCKYLGIYDNRVNLETSGGEK